MSRFNPGLAAAIADARASMGASRQRVEELLGAPIEEVLAQAEREYADVQIPSFESLSADLAAGRERQRASDAERITLADLRNRQFQRYLESQTFNTIPGIEEPPPVRTYMPIPEGGVPDSEEQFRQQQIENVITARRELGDLIQVPFDESAETAERERLQASDRPSVESILSGVQEDITRIKGEQLRADVNPVSPEYPTLNTAGEFGANLVRGAVDPFVGVANAIAGTDIPTLSETQAGRAGLPVSALDTPPEPGVPGSQQASVVTQTIPRFLGEAIATAPAAGAGGKLGAMAAEAAGLGPLAATAARGGGAMVGFDVPGIAETAQKEGGLAAAERAAGDVLVGGGLAAIPKALIDEVSSLIGKLKTVSAERAATAAGEFKTAQAVANREESFARVRALRDQLREEVATSALERRLPEPQGPVGPPKPQGQIGPPVPQLPPRPEPRPREGFIPEPQGQVGPPRPQRIGPPEPQGQIGPPKPQYANMEEFAKERSLPAPVPPTPSDATINAQLKGERAAALRSTVGSLTPAGANVLPSTPDIQGLYEGARETTKAIREGWAHVVRTPTRLINAIPDESIIGRARDQLRHVSVRYPDYGRFAARARGAQALAEEDAVKRVKDEVFTKMVDEELYKAHRALAGKVKISDLPKEVQPWIRQARGMLDDQSRQLLDELKAAGMQDTQLYRSVEKNLGQYVGEYLPPRGPIESARRWIGNLSKKRLATERFRRKRPDAWSLRVGSGNQAKYVNLAEEYGIETEAEAKDFLAQLKEVRKAGFIKANADGVISTDLKNAVLQGKDALSLEAPLTEADRIAMGFVRDPRVGFGRSYLDAERNIANLKLYRQTRDLYAMRPPEGAEGDALQEWARRNGLKQMPKNERLGAVSEAWLPRQIAQDINETYAERSLPSRIWNAYLNEWKASKTMYNPATHARNFIGNFVFADLAGISPANPGNGKYYRKAFLELMNKGVAYREAVREGVIGTEYFGNEVRDHILLLPKESGPWDNYLLNLYRRMRQKTGRLYNGEDQIFKIASYLKQREAGMSVEDAAAHVDKWFPNYSNIAPATKVLSRMPLGAPFVAFLDQAGRIGLRAAAEHPIKVAKWAALPGIITGGSVLYMGMSPEEKEMLDERRSYFEPIVPWRDSRGRAQTFDLRYIIPFANDVPNMNSRTRKLYARFFFGQPGISQMQDLIYNQDAYTGREIIGKDDNRFFGAAKHVVAGMIPAPSFIVSGIPRVRRALKGEGQREDVYKAIVGVLTGISLRPGYVSRQDAYNKLREEALTVPAVARVVNKVLGGDIRRRSWQAFTRDIDSNQRFAAFLHYFDVYRTAESDPILTKNIAQSIGSRARAGERRIREEGMTREQAARKEGLERALDVPPPTPPTKEEFIQSLMKENFSRERAEEIWREENEQRKAG